ncbi:MAG TPA: dihydropteroate synthase [Gammaproteobacteria bacterium]|nr:dihydropteroate synthase [Gammaproteobacteria bacterium]
MSQVLQCADRPLDLRCPQVMGILNVTPDSFSDGGLFVSVDAALMQTRRMVAQGAAIIDVGGESTRPGATAVSVQEELDRVAPVVEAIARELPPVIVSVDTSKAAVMTEAVALGAGLINDVRALREPGALQAASDAGVPVCLMHMAGDDPRSMQEDPHYVDVVDDITLFLRGRIRACEAAGIPASRLLLDPGFGFGKRVTHNLLIMQRLREFLALGKPLLIGVSRKSMIGAVLDRAAHERLPGSLALATMACQQGAQIIRAHDVAATVDAVKMWHAVRTVS